jgi:hypothetical protein
MQCNWLPDANFLIQLFLLGAVVWYAVETRTIRIVSQKQIEKSQNQIELSQQQVEASQQQVETSQKPCLTFEVNERSPSGDDEGDQVIAPSSEGHYLQLKNLGFGPAFNVRYKFIPNANASQTPLTGSLNYVPLGDPTRLSVLFGNIRNSKWDVEVDYQSASGRGYKTVITVDGPVMTNIIHRQIKETQLSG